MPAKDIEIPFPFGGLNEDTSHSAQNPIFTKEAVNVRDIDPLTGRERGAQRSGTSKFIESKVSAACSGGSSGISDRVQDMAVVTYDRRMTSYSVIADGSDWEVMWKTAVPADFVSQTVTTDRFGNVYALSGYNGVAKYNGDGKLLTSWEVPLQSAMQRLRALVVDEISNVLTAVNYAPQGSQSRMWKYEQQEDGTYAILWFVNLLGSVADMVLQRGLLYVLENRPDSFLPTGIPSSAFGRAYISVWDNLDAVEPRKLFERAVPYPAGQIRVNAAGDVFVCSGPNGLRGSRAGLGFSTPSIDWTPEQLEDWDGRKWAWLDARDLLNYVDGDEITFWQDKTGNGRNLFHWGSSGFRQWQGGGDFVTRTDVDPPTYRSAGLADQPTVRFDGRHGLGSQDTTGTNADQAVESNLSLIPSVNSRKFTTAWLVTIDQGNGLRGTIWEQTGELKIRLNANEDDAASNEGTESPGMVRMHIDPVEAAGGADASTVKAGSFQTSTESLRNDIAIIVLRHGGDDTSEASILRVNGVEVDRFTVNRDQIRAASFVGFKLVELTESEPDDFRGEIAEIVTVMDDSDSPSGGTSGVDNELERLEGYLAHKWGAQHVLDSGHPYKAAPPTGGPSGGSSSGGSSAFNEVLKSEQPIVAKFGAAALSVKWAFAGSGVGYGLALDKAGGVYNIGPVISGPSGGSSGHSGGASGEDQYDATLRKIQDDGDSFTHVWQIFRSQIPEIDYTVIMFVDDDKNLYVPHHEVTGQTVSTFYKIDGDGEIEAEFDTPGTLRVGYCVAPAPKPIDFDENIGEPEFVYLCTFQGDEGSGLPTLWKIRLVSSTLLSGSPRTTVYLSVGAGAIRKMIPGQTAPNDLVTPTGGCGALDESSVWVQSAALFQQVFFVDGQAIKVYDPKDDAVVTYQPTSPGAIPPRPRLVVPWRRRLVFSRFDAQPHQWFMAKAGDPYNVDLAPPEGTTPIQAVLGSDSRVGLAPDIVNALAPIEDDMLLFGGDKSIHRMTGDPMAGGEFDLVTDEVGMAFGRPWAKDDAGVIYFFGSAGGVYAMDLSGGKPIRISEKRIDRRLTELDLGSYTVRMAWNNRDRGLHIWITPLGEPDGSTIEHYFWRKDKNRWWADQFSDSGMNPTAVLVIDGDEPDDRTILLGGADGHVRKWDKGAVNDDGERIDSRVLIGPFRGASGEQIRFGWLRAVLASEQGGLDYEIVASETPEIVDAFSAVGGTFRPGRNPRGLDRRKGHAVFLRLRNAKATERWALESLMGRVAPAGMARKR